MKARRDWQARIHRPSGEVTAAPAVDLPPPGGLHATPGRGCVTLTWEPVPGATGYTVERSPFREGPYGVTSQPDVDVAAVPSCRYVDTGQDPSWYRVSAVGGPAGSPVHGSPGGPGVARVAVSGTVARELPRPWRFMIGSEHLSYMFEEKELVEALRLAHTELGVATVRAHAILDEVRVLDDGYDFSRVDQIYDTLMEIGLRPIVELSFMPEELAADPSKTVFGYEAIISPPKDWDAWGDLVRAFTQHCADRYGLRELVDNWAFEVWNEPNLEVFWSGTPDDYFRLYEISAAAVKDVHPGLRVGGPSSAANGWVEELIARGLPVDFVSTHTYGNAPLDWRPALERHGLAGTPIWWTEWGPTPTHFHGIGDGPFGASFLLHGMKSAAGRVESLSHWVASDHFEELGRPPRLFHGGFGLLSVGNLRKPRWWALELANRLGEEELVAKVEGDAGGVEVWAARRPDGTVGILLWNGTLNQAKADGDPDLSRTVTVTVDDLGEGDHTVTHHRIDERHSNIRAHWHGTTDWPTDAEWEALRAADVLEELTPPVTTSGSTIRVAFDLPMPGVSYLEITTP
uniref:GH39 family glycosyl hydrolase n=1 Tax=Herbidospora sakaeratensis TaxID=564415 RepID=UPI000A64D693|nr:xylan 1,4-beta-xylosidase [Herbidospora sakaeratensis]